MLLCIVALWHLHPTLRYETESTRYITSCLTTPQEASSDSLIARVGILVATGTQLDLFSRAMQLTYVFDIRHFRERW
jgi:hypothetical protein